MNFVIFPMFFASSALYPLWKVRESSPLLYEICRLNPFTHAVELVRFALYAKMEWVALPIVVGCAVVFMVGAIIAYDRGARARGPARGGRWTMKAMDFVFWTKVCRPMVAWVRLRAGDRHLRSHRRPVPSIRAIPTGRVTASRCRSSRWPPCWTGPDIGGVGNAWREDREVNELVGRIVVRRTPQEEAEKAIADFITGDAATRERKSQAGDGGRVFTVLGGEARPGDEWHRTFRPAGRRVLRTRSVTKPARSANSRTSRTTTPRRSTNSSRSSPGNTRIFEDQKRTINYVCDVPQAIERRVFITRPRHPAGAGVRLALTPLSSLRVRHRPSVDLVG